MDNQHQKISGYRDLSQAEIDLMNEIKAKADEVGALCAKLVATGAHVQSLACTPPDSSRAGADQRWVGIGKTHLQQGFMALVRSVAKPNSF